MGFMDKISKLVSQNDSEYYDDAEEEYEDEYYDEAEEEEAPAAPKKSAFGVFRSSSANRSDNVVDINNAPASGRKNRVVLAQPAVFSDAKGIADHVNQRCLVILNLKDTGSETTRRFVDFLSGVAYANNGKITRIDTAVFIITPSGYDLTGDMVESIQNGEIYFG
ncbi:MAG: cell division protein SepF [Clostridia bacterium]|nr:cell division protein SepF [Clostridia bacterium]